MLAQPRTSKALTKLPFSPVSQGNAAKGGDRPERPDRPGAPSAAKPPHRTMAEPYDAYPAAYHKDRDEKGHIKREPVNHATAGGHDGGKAAHGEGKHTSRKGERCLVPGGPSMHHGSYTLPLSSLMCSTNGGQGWDAGQGWLGCR